MLVKFFAELIITIFARNATNYAYCLFREGEKVPF